MSALPSTTRADPWRDSFQAHGARLLLFARQWLPVIADAEDAVQEGFVRFWRKRPGPLGDDLGLLFAAVRSAALDHIRGESRRQRREQNAWLENRIAHNGSEPIAAPFFDGDLSSAGHPVQSALEGLPPEQREVLVLKIWGELTFAQIAAALSISQNTAASRYRYALGSLRKLLQPTHE